MPKEPGFNKAIVETLGKRAAFRCSNPDCNVLTAGPNESSKKSTIIGDAAHILGSKKGSAHFDPSMTDAERDDITNGIWLCKNCHKRVDDNPDQYSVQLLYLWRRSHEKAISEQLGKQGDLLRLKAMSPTLKLFEGSSPLAQQIVIDKPDYWEFKLLAELLRAHFAEIRRRWNDLRGELYSRETTIVPFDDLSLWLQSKLNEIGVIVDTFSNLVNREVQVAWGAPGEAGSPKEILRVGKLIFDACIRLIEWEESIRFAYLGDEFDGLKELLADVTTNLIEQTERIPREITGILEEIEPSGKYVVKLDFDVPKDFVEKFDKLLVRAYEKRLLEEY